MLFLSTTLSLPLSLSLYVRARGRETPKRYCRDDSSFSKEILSSIYFSSKGPGSQCPDPTWNSGWFGEKTSDDGCAGGWYGSTNIAADDAVLNVSKSPPTSLIPTPTYSLLSSTKGGFSSGPFVGAPDSRQKTPPNQRKQNHHDS